jgi:hypothetical protein
MLDVPLVMLNGRISITCYGVMAVNGVIEECSVGRKSVAVGLSLQS